MEYLLLRTKFEHIKTGNIKNRIFIFITNKIQYKQKTLSQVGIKIKITKNKYTLTLLMADIQKFGETITKESSMLQHHSHVVLQVDVKAAQTLFPKRTNL